MGLFVRKDTDGFEEGRWHNFIGWGLLLLVVIWFVWTTIAGPATTQHGNLQLLWLLLILALFVIVVAGVIVGIILLIKKKPIPGVVLLILALIAFVILVPLPKSIA